MTNELPKPPPADCPIGHRYVVLQLSTGERFIVTERFFKPGEEVVRLEVWVKGLGPSVGLGRADGSSCP